MFENWIIYPLSYYNFIRSDFIIFKTRSKKIIKLRKHSTDLMALTHVWLIEEYKKENFEIKQNDVVIDVGAHIGLFTIYASQFCTNGKIYSFEPVTENYQLLLDNIKLNNLNYVTSFNQAISNSNDSIELFLNNDESGHSMFSKSSKSVKIDSISLQTFFDENQINHCNFLKLDCEGAEYEIIEKLPLKYFKMIEKMVIEYHMFDLHPELLEKLKNKLLKNNFKFEMKTLFSDIGFLYAVKN